MSTTATRLGVFLVIPVVPFQLAEHLPLSDWIRLVPSPVGSELSSSSLLEIVALQLWSYMPPAFLQDRLWLRAEAAVVANGVCTRRSNGDCARLVQNNPSCSLSLPGVEKVATCLLPNVPAAPWGGCPVPLHPSGVCAALGSTVTLLLPLLA